MRSGVNAKFKYCSYLSHKRSEVVVFEVVRKDFLGELVYIFDHKGLSIIVPAHDILIIFVLFIHSGKSELGIEGK